MAMRHRLRASNMWNTGIPEWDNRAIPVALCISVLLVLVFAFC